MSEEKVDEDKKMRAIGEVLKAANKLADMKFDAAVGNPPYQNESIDASGRPSIQNVFHQFYSATWGISDSVSMIFPGGRWMNGQAKLSDASDFILSTANYINWYPNGDEKGIQKLFPTERISDGLSIVAGSKDNDSFYVNGISMNRPESGGIIPLTEYGTKIVAKAFDKSDKTVSERRLPRAFFQIQSNWTSLNSGGFSPIEENHNFKNPIKAFLSDDNKTIMAKKVKEYWIDHSSVAWTSEKEQVFKSWKVTAPSVLKTPSEVTYRVIDNEHIIGESWVIVGYFATEDEAVNYRSYLVSNLARLLLDESKGGRLKSFGVFLPDLKDYTNSNPLFTSDDMLPDGHEYIGLSLDERLYKYFKLSEDEISTVEKN